MWMIWLVFCWGGRFAVWFAVIFACLGDLVLGGVKFLGTGLCAITWFCG